MVIDELIVIENGEQKKVDSADNKVIDVINYNSVDYHFAKVKKSNNKTLQNAVAEPIIDMKIYGNSVQKSYTGKNLFDSDVKNLQSLLYLEDKYRFGYDFGVLPVGNYVFSFELMDSAVIPTYVYIMVKGTTGYLENVGHLTTTTIRNNPLIFNVTEAKNYYFVFADGSVNTSEIAQERMAMFKWLQLEVGTVPTDYEPYVGGEPSPSINYPQPIKSLGEKTKNLFNMNYYGLKRVPYSDTAERWGYDVGVLPAGDYNFNFELVDNSVVPNSVYVRQKNADGSITGTGSLTTSVISKNPLKFTADGQTNYYVICASNSVGTLEQAIERFEQFKHIQLEVGSVVTEYEPYGYKIPIKVTPTTYEFKPDKITINQISATSSRCGFDLGILEAGSYIIGLDLVNDGVYPEYIYMRQKYEDGIYSDNIYITTNIVNYSPVKFDADGKSNFYLFFALISSDIEAAKQELRKIRHIYLQKGSTIQSNTTTIYTIEPLRKVGDYVDYIDYANNKIVRNVNVLDDSGTKTIANSYQNLSNTLEELIIFPTIRTFDGTNIVDIRTEIEPSGFNMTYWRQIMPDEVEEEIIDNITQTGSNILIVSTGAEITQSDTNLRIGG